MSTPDPRGWRTVADPNTGRSYYYHRDIRETSWVKPQALIDYENSVSNGDSAASAATSYKASTPDKNPSTKAKIIKNETKEAKIKVVTDLLNCSIGGSSNHIPLSDDIAWTQAVDSVSGWKYYYNKSTNETSWFLPVVEWNRSNLVDSIDDKVEDVVEKELDNKTKVQEESKLEKHFAIDDTSLSPWAVRIHMESAEIFYENTVTGVRVWEDPVSLVESLADAVNADMLEEEEGLERSIIELVGYELSPSHINFETNMANHCRAQLSQWIKDQSIQLPSKILNNRLTFPTYMIKEADAVFTVPSQFRVQMRMPGFMVTSIQFLAQSTDTVGDIIQKTFTFLKNKRIEIDTSVHYILKLTGFEDYLIDHDARLLHHEYVQAAFRGYTKNTFIKLTAKRVTHTIKKELEARIAFDKKVVTDITPSIFDYKEVQQGATSSSSNHGITETKRGGSILVQDLPPELTFRVKIIGALNLDIPDNIGNLFIKVQLFYNGEAMRTAKGSTIDLTTEYPTQCQMTNGLRLSLVGVVSDAPEYTPASSNPRWPLNTWLASTLPLKDMPLATRITYTVYGVDDKTNKPLYYASMYPFDHKRELIVGKMSVPLLPVQSKETTHNHHKDSASTQMYTQSGPVVTTGESDSACLNIEFDSYCTAIVSAMKYINNRPRLSSSRTTSSNLLTSNTDTPLEPSASVYDQLLELLETNPLTTLNFADRRVLWKYRHWITMTAQLPDNKLPISTLSNLLKSATWTNPSEVTEARSLLQLWRHIKPEFVLELLDTSFSDPIVRLFAVKRLASMPDHIFVDYLLQLVQALKFEHCHDSPLARLLIQRGLHSPTRIGQTLFWLLRSDMHDVYSCERHAIILELYLRYCGEHRLKLSKQNHVNMLLQRITQKAASLPEDKDLRNEYAQSELNRIKPYLPLRFELCFSARIACNGIEVDESRIMGSKQAPLWTVFTNVDEGGEKIPVLFKAGDDLRQDLMTLQMLTIMDKIWLQHGLDLRLLPYGCMCTGKNVGMIEIVKNSDTIARMIVRTAGVYGAFDKTPINDWLLQEHCLPYDHCVENFIHSCAGYCVATYVMGIGDRHPSNIMINREGNLFHIDFGHVLGNFKSKYGIKRERSAFVFTSQMLEVMGGSIETAKFKKFSTSCCDGFNLLRERGNLFMSLFRMMIPAGMPELQQVEDILYLRNQLLIEKTPSEAGAAYVIKLREALSTSSRLMDNFIHVIKHKMGSKQ